MIESIQERQSGAAFSRQAPVFDALDRSNPILVWMRGRVRGEVMRHARTGDRMLELNCGTGIDALYFAQQGLQVIATDNAPGMLDACREKVSAAGLEKAVDVRNCSFNQLHTLQDLPTVDYVFSNFGGLNCTPDLPKVLNDIDALLRPGGHFTLVIMPRICPWELALSLRGLFRTAFRRLRRGGIASRVEGLPFHCYYYDPGLILKTLGPGFKLCTLQTLGLAVPPPYMDGFARRFPRVFRFLANAEPRIAGFRPFNRCGDHYIITMRKSPAAAVNG